MTTQPLTSDDIRHIIREEMEVFRNELREHYATNTSLAEAKGDLREGLAELRGDLGKDLSDVKGDLEKNLSEVKGDLEKNLSEVKGDLEKNLSEVKGELSREITSLQVSLKTAFQTFYIVVGALNVSLAALTLILKFFVG